MKRDLGKKIWTYTVMIVVMGLVALYSASHDNVRVPQKIFYDQLIWAMIGFGLMYLLGRVDYRKFYDVAYVFSAGLTFVVEPGEVHEIVNTGDTNLIVTYFGVRVDRESS